jgi:hypothetical protein
VYCLFGISNETDENIVYIGQAGARKNGEGILYRLQEHKRDSEKDYWTEAIVFITSDNSFGPTEISYLENKFCKLATESKRYVVKNRNDPPLGNITKEKECELEEFAEISKMLMGTLGHKVFEPLAPKKPVLTETNNALGISDYVFHVAQSGCNANCKITAEGCVVLSGSAIRKDVVKSCPDYIKKLREKYKKNIDNNDVLKIDLLFNSPSAAAGFVIGGSANGKTAFITEDGKTLKDIEEVDSLNS